MATTNNNDNTNKRAFPDFTGAGQQSSSYQSQDNSHGDDGGSNNDNAKRKRELMLASVEQRLSSSAQPTNSARFSESRVSSASNSATASTSTPRPVIYAADVITDDDITEDEEQPDHLARKTKTIATVVTVKRTDAVIDLTSECDDDDDDDDDDDQQQTKNHKQNEAAAASSSDRVKIDPFASTFGPLVPESQRKGRLAFYLNKLPDVQDSVSVTMSDIVQPSDARLQSVIMFNYLFDIDWLYTQLPGLERVQTQFVQHEKLRPYQGRGYTAHEIRSIEKQYRDSRYPLLSLTVCRPEDPYGTHHTKLIICKFKTGLRVCVGTANMVPMDWIKMSNAFCIQDFPLKDVDSPPSSRFSKDLITYLVATRASCDDQDCITQLIGLVHQYDMSGSTAILAGSVPGYHKSSAAIAANGLVRIGECVKDCNVPPNAPMVVNISSVSVPHDKAKWLEEELCGLLAPGMPPGNLRVAWPTRQQIEECKHPECGGSLCYPGNKALKDDYLRPRFFHRYDTAAYGRQRYLAHMKSIVRFSPDMSNSSKDPGTLYWMYMGSHNLSRAALGNFQKKGTQTQVRSFELGVVFTNTSYDPLHRHVGFTCTPDFPLPGQTIVPTSAEFEMRALAGDATTMQKNVLYFPIPHSLSPEKYTSSDVPWYWYDGWESRIEQLINARS